MALFGKKKEESPAGFPDVNAPSPDSQGYYQQQDPYVQAPAQPGYGQDPYAQQAQPMPDPMSAPAPDPMGAPAPEPMADPGYAEQGAGYSGGDDRERIEEIAEAIIDEKWNELTREIQKVVEWKERTENTLSKMMQEIQNLKERFESLHKGVLGKITEYDQNLSNVGSEIKAMEMAFQKILPTFTENVSKLERYTKGMGE